MNSTEKIINRSGELASYFVSVCRLACVALFLSACSTQGQYTGGQLTDEQLIEKMSLERLGYLKSLNYEEAYKLMSPGYRSVKDINRFKLDFGGSHNIRGFEFDSVACDDDVCTSYVNVTYELGGSAGGLNVVRTNIETWAKIDGRWWFMKSK